MISYSKELHCPFQRNGVVGVLLFGRKAVLPEKKIEEFHQDIVETEHGIHKIILC